MYEFHISEVRLSYLQAQLRGVRCRVLSCLSVELRLTDACRVVGGLGGEEGPLRRRGPGFFLFTCLEERGDQVRLALP